MFESNIKSKIKKVTFGIDTTKSTPLILKEVTNILLSIDKTYHIKSFTVSCNLLTVKTFSRNRESNLKS